MRACECQPFLLQTADLWPKETNEVVALPPRFFCKINSASGGMQQAVLYEWCKPPQAIHIPEPPGLLCCSASITRLLLAPPPLLQEADIQSSFFLEENALALAVVAPWQKTSMKNSLILKHLKAFGDYISLLYAQSFEILLFLNIYYHNKSPAFLLGIKASTVLQCDSTLAFLKGNWWTNIWLLLVAY